MDLKLLVDMYASTGNVVLRSIEYNMGSVVRQVISFNGEIVTDVRQVYHPLQMSMIPWRRTICYPRCSLLYDELQVSVKGFAVLTTLVEQGTYITGCTLFQPKTSFSLCNGV